MSALSLQSQCQSPNCGQKTKNGVLPAPLTSFPRRLLLCTAIQPHQPPCCSSTSRTFYLGLILLGVCVCVCVPTHMFLHDQSCLTLCHTMGCSPPRSSVHGILQARILEWVSISCSWGSSLPRD